MLASVSGDLGQRQRTNAAMSHVDLVVNAGRALQRRLVLKAIRVPLAQRQRVLTPEQVWAESGARMNCGDACWHDLRGEQKF